MNLKFINYTKLSSKEHDQLLVIRNKEYVRLNMKNDTIIELTDHLSWINALKEDRSKIYYAILSESTLVGGINITDIDMENKISSWGLFMQNNLNPMIPSLATYIIIDKIFNTLDIERLNLEVNKLNINAYKFDRNFGFIDYGEYNDAKNSYHLMYMEKETWESSKATGLLKILNSKLEKIDYEFQE